jgi:hypothetical protein
MDDRRYITIAVPALLAIITAFFAIALLDHGTGEPLGTTLAVGTVSSLIATVITSVIRVVTAVRGREPSRISHLPGLVRVTPKNALTADEWLHFLQTAKTEFYVAGHSLGKWCSATNRDDFKSHVRRILEHKGRVTLVMLDPTSPQIDRLQRATSVDYTSRIDTSLRVLAELCGELQAPARDRLTIAVLKDHPTLSYMVVGNEQRLVTASYLGSSDTDDVACMELARASDAATVVYDDFHKLAEAGAMPTLPSVTARPSPPPTQRPRTWRRLLGR